MTPTRALTIAIKAALENEAERGLYSAPDTGNPYAVEMAAAALRIAAVAIEHFPEGWELLDAAAIHHELSEIDQKLNESGSTITLLLAFRIQQDGHAKTLGEALRIAEDPHRVRELYPDIRS